MQTLLQVYFRMPIFFRLLSSVLLLMMFFGIAIHILEPDHFPTIFDGIWWAFVTGSTVGYGDYVPLSSAGRIVAILLILAGGGLVTFYMATISAGTIKHERDLSKGLVKYRGKDHVILVGWNERTKQLMEMIVERDMRKQIVLIDHTMSNLPYQKHHLHFIRGSAFDDETLEKANLKQAKYAVVTADPSKKELQADQTTILTAVAIKGNNPEIMLITEILTKDQIKNASRAGADSIIRSNDFMSTLIFHELFRHKPVKPFDLLIQVLADQQFHQFPLPEDLYDKTFLQCADYYAVSEQLLIGIMRKEQMLVNPAFSTKLQRGDTLIVLSSLHE
ncbi:potassium channel protein [Sediminibacillus dalangtanensis]|uniref:Potassium channel protein n=1 Tax=Sediminibacillus dalangtanensis TaxID=2729421 RepID=A0ABX7VUF8_9BACI|nr:potassium channel family protein [Sediminibacillus dalangtanensis]QTN00174.1 potassium channel protein [Sediminibacillus dalangtanensis]